MEKSLFTTLRMWEGKLQVHQMPSHGYASGRSTGALSSGGRTGALSSGGSTGAIFKRGKMGVAE
jgi:hypothetical protein